MDKISHESARRLIQSLPGERLPAENRQLAEHLEGCPACRRFAAEMDDTERMLRRELRARINPAPIPAPAYRQISARLRAQTMKKQVLNFAGVAAVILLVIGLLVTLPTLIPQPGSPRIVPPAPKPISTEPAATAEPTQEKPAPTDAETTDSADFSAQFLFLSAEGDQQTLNLGGPDGSSRNLLESAQRVNGAAWSPDGAWIAYIDACSPQPGSADSCQPDIFVMTADGGNITRLTTASGLEWSAPLAWSPDGKYLAASAKRLGANELGSQPLGLEDLSALYIIPLDGSGPRRVSNTEGAQYPRWSPDGAWLGFVREELGLSKLYVYNVLNNYAVPIEPRLFRVLGEVQAEGSFSVARDGLYAWLPTPTGSPADASLAFLAEGPYIDGKLIPQALGLVLVREGIDVPRLSDAVRITSGLKPGAMRDLSLSTNGEIFALALKNAENQCSDLYFFENSDGAGLQTFPSACLTGRPGGITWTPDSRWVLFSAMEGEQEHVVAASALIASEPRAPGASLSVTRYQKERLWPQVRPQGPSLSIAPAGNTPKAKAVFPPAQVANAPGQIIYSASDGEKNRLFASRPDGGGVRKLLPDDTAAQFGPVVSPDGEWVAFMLQQDSITPALPYLLHPGDAAPRRIMNQDFPTSTNREEGRPDGKPQPGDIIFPIYTAPAWSPDSQTLAVQVNVNNGMSYQLALVPTDGSLKVRYVEVGSSAEGGPNPAWSPDGQQMVISLGEYGLADLYLLDPNQGSGDPQKVNLTNSIGWSEGTGAVWSPDGERLAYFAHPPEPAQGAVIGQELRQIRPDGSDTRTLAVLEPNADGSNPFPYLLRWSPDGRWLSYMLNRSGGYGLVRYQLVLIDAQSGESRILLDLDDQSLQTYTWSPDGQWLAFSTDQGTYVLNVSEALTGISGPVKINDLPWIYSLGWRK